MRAGEKASPSCTQETSLPLAQHTPRPRVPGCAHSSTDTRHDLDEGGKQARASGEERGQMLVLVREALDEENVDRLARS